MAKNYRPERLGEEIRKIISNMLLKDLTDPRFSLYFPSITAVDVTNDGSLATVYISMLAGVADGTDHEKGSGVALSPKDDLLAAFNGAKGMIRTQIGKNIKLRHTPDLIFKMDNALEYGRRIDDILRNLDIKSDEEISELVKTGVYKDEFEDK